MKKLLFALEVLLMLSVLPFFFGMALGRKHHVNPESYKAASPVVNGESNETTVVYPKAQKNS